jgi:thiol-disulfide isomerase/thioredoxin
MKKSMISIVMALLCLFLKVSAQSLTTEMEKPNGVKPLIIGDKVPDLEFEKAPNMPSGKLKLSDYRGKALILDFWGTWCSACIMHFPHNQKIQNKYSKNLQFLLINDSVRDSLESVIVFLNKRKKDNEQIMLPVIQTHKDTRDLFPHRSYPHYVWIGADRRIKAITTADELEEESLERLIAGFDLNLPIKRP